MMTKEITVNKKNTNNFSAMKGNNAAGSNLGIKRRDIHGRQKNNSRSNAFRSQIDFTKPSNGSEKEKIFKSKSRGLGKQNISNLGVGFVENIDDDVPGEEGGDIKGVRSLAEHSQRKPGIDAILEKLRSQLAKRGTRGICGLGRKFKIMDDDGSSSITADEFTKGMRETGLNLSKTEYGVLFRYFDKDGDKSISYEEFLAGVREKMNDRRRKIVSQAFGKLDKDGNGVIEPADLLNTFDASHHPDVLCGKKTPDEVLREFLDTFDVGGVVDGKVTQEEFMNYYENVSMSIDLDDYFELSVRNAYHITGGEGWCANSSNRRVLVTNSKGQQSIVEIKDDLGLKMDDQRGIMARLRTQGVDAVGVSSLGAVEKNSPKQTANSRPKSPPAKSGRKIVSKNPTYSSQFSLSHD
uniref:EF-hand domain-containing protein n=1 Tax=Octactis speculum TaxID=3111310 RepID=A0A7S2AKR6_9STRA|mmetsp:Transcript_1173/g.1430  ORF Transcript_1173/g.1430 Transcript_1173/m.1430 type:complete len:409 (+) Transcript_1173:987-2213(+)